MEFNLGTGKGYSVLEMIQAFEKVVNIKIPYQFCDRRSGDFIEAYADYSLVKNKLNWEPKTTLKESIYTAYSFQKQISY